MSQITNGGYEFNGIMLMTSSLGSTETAVGRTMDCHLYTWCFPTDFMAGGDPRKLMFSSAGMAI